MKLKLFAKTVVTLLLVATLIITFIASPILANSDFVDGSGDHISTQNTGKDVSSDPTKLGTATFGTTDLDYPKSETLTGGKVEPNSTVGDKNNLSSTNEWSKLIGDNKGSAQLVIGINNGRLDAHARLMDIVAKHDCEVVNTVSMVEEIIAVVVNVSLKEMSSFVQETRANGLSRYIEPRMKVQAQLVPNDPYWSLQWGPQKIEADWAWNTTIGDPSVLVAVIDTGIDWNHPDLAANYVSLGYDWVNNDPDPMDDEGHGTHCAGIVAAVINNSIGVAGLARVSIMAEKGLDQYGGGYEDDLANAIIHAVDQGADILSNSWGGYGEMELIHDAVRYAHDAGVLVIAAAGNEATSTRLYPAAYDEVIAVTATDWYDNPASFTNFGEWVELAAPGVDIYSTYWDNTYTSMSGTSMSTPHVSGVAALIWSQFPNMTRDWMQAHLRFTADDLGASGFDYYYGYGRINARNAVEQAPPDHDLLIFNWEKPRYIQPGDLVSFNVTVLNYGINNESNTMVQLLVDGNLTDSASISFLASGTSTTVGVSWNPTVEEIYNVTFYVVPVPGETAIENNIVTEMIEVRYPIGYVLFDQTHGTDSIAYYSIWVANLTDRAYVVDTLTKSPITPSMLEGYDVFVIPQAHGYYSSDELSAIQDFVLDGGGLLVIGDDDPYIYTGLTSFTGIYWTYGGVSGITYDIMYHEVTEGVTSVYLDAPIAEILVTVPALDIVRDPAGGIMLAVSEQFGRVIGFADEGSLWDYGIGYEDNLRLANNMIDWLLGVKYEHELVVRLDAPNFLKPGDSSLLNATVYNRGLNNETDVDLFLLINGTIANNVTIPELVNGTSYTIDYLWMPTIEGIYNITAYAPPVPDENVTANNWYTKFVRVTYAVMIGIIETHGESLHSEELVNYYTSLGHVVEKITTTITLGVLDNYDIIVVGEDWGDIHWVSSEIVAVEAFIDSGKGFIAIGDELAHSVQEILGTHGISYAGISAPGGSSSHFDPLHPIMQNVSLIYASAPVNSLQISSPAYWIANDISDTYILIAGAEVGGYVLCLSNDFAAYLYNDDNEVMFKNIIDWMTVKYEHELVVRLDAPNFLKPGDSSLLNAAVYNRGLSNETDVELFLLINGTAVNSVTIPELVNGTYHTIDYLWTPTAEATYNVTAYAVPVPGENITANNQESKFVEVSEMVIAVVLDSYGTDYASNTFWDYLNTNWATYGTMRIVIDYTSLNKENIMLADIEATHADVLIISDAWSDTYAYGWEFSDSEIESIKTYVLSGHGIIATSGTFDTWSAPNNQKLAELFGMDPTIWYNWGLNGDEKVTNGIFELQTLHHNELWRNIADPYLSGSLVTLNPTPHFDWAIQGIITGWIEALSTDHYAAVITSETITHKAVYFTCMLESMGQYNENNRQLFYNALVWTQLPLYDHELVVSIEAPNLLEPGESTSLNATVHNCGLSNETDVELQLLINGSIVDSVVIQELLIGSSYTLSYMWTPTVEATYNVTVYAPPALGENVTVNNLVSKIVRVCYITVALISDHSELLAITPILNSMGIGYDIYNDNSIYLYTEDLDLLLNYQTVIFYTGYRHITSNEHTALESYLSSGGSLLVTGFDSLISDDLLRDIIRSATMGDNVGEPDLFVVDESHPIMNGPYGSFPAGYHIFGLYSDCDAIEADTGRNSITVAELWDGYDKIIATEGLPGKVVYWNGRGDYDWIWNTDCEAMFKNMLVWFIIRYEHELTVSLDSPTLVELGDSSLLNATVNNRGLSNETDVELFLLINGAEVESVLIPELLSGSSYTLSYLWTPTVEGIYNVTAYAPPVPGENVTVNNFVSRIVHVRKRVQLSIIPATIIGPPPGIGESFTVGIYIENVINLTGWQVGLAWNASVLNCTSWTTLFNTAVMGPQGNWIWIEGTINNTNGRVYPPYAYSLIWWGTPKSGSDFLAEINFTVLDYGFTWINLTYVQVRSNWAETPVDVADGTFELPPCYQLTVNSLPINGIMFTINGTPQTTPYTEWLLEGSYTLVMPETHTVGEAKYYWNQWSDGNTSRSRTVVMDTNITLTAHYTGPYYQLTVTSSPIRRITFTINGVKKTTPYTEWLLEGSYTLVMPETHNRYVWSHWLEDKDTNRIKTILLQGTTWTAVYKRPTPVGGKATPINIPINKPETPVLWIWLPTIILPLVATIVFVKLKKKKH